MSTPLGAGTVISRVLAGLLGGYAFAYGFTACLHGCCRSPGRLVCAAGRVQAWGWAMGAVGWFGQPSLAAFGLVMLLPYAPRLTPWLPVAGLPSLGVLGWAG